MWWILFWIEISGPKAATLLQNTPSLVFYWGFFCKIAYVRKFLMFTVIIKRVTYTEAHLGLCYAHLTLHIKWSFLLRLSSVNVTKSAGNRGFGHIYGMGKLHFSFIVKWSSLRKQLTLAIFSRDSVSDVWVDSEYTSDTCSKSAINQVINVLHEPQS